jgi:hypothetical protein
VDNGGGFCIVAHMPTEDQVNDLARRLAPHLQEHGVAAFMICAVMADADGNAARVSFSGAPSNTDPKFLAMLLSIDRLGTCWSKGQL